MERNQDAVFSLIKQLQHARCNSKSFIYVSAYLIFNSIQWVRSYYHIHFANQKPKDLKVVTYLKADRLYSSCVPPKGTRESVHPEPDLPPPFFQTKHRDPRFFCQMTPNSLLGLKGTSLCPSSPRHITMLLVWAPLDLKSDQGVTDCGIF